MYFYGAEAKMLRKKPNVRDKLTRVLGFLLFELVKTKLLKLIIIFSFFILIFY